MRASIFFFAFALFALVSAQSNANTDRFLIDDFTINQGQNITIILAASVNQGDTPVIQGNTFFRAGCGSGLIGCGRNMRIEVFAGEIQRQFTSQIFPSSTFNFTGEWDISNPKGGSSISYNLYQGNSGSFTTVNPAGLGGVDFTEGGLSTGLRFALISDLASTFSVDLYDVSGGVSTGTAQFNSLPGQTYTQAQITDDILYTSFTGNCDFTRVGAVEIAIPSQDAVDAIVYQVRGVGFPNPSASPSPSTPPTQSNSPSTTPGPSQSQTPAASQSNTPSQTPGPSQTQTPAASQSNTPSNTPAPSQTRTPAPSQSNTPAASSTPSATPSNSGPCIIFCQCPSFTCVILYETSLNGFNDIDFDFVPGDSVMTSDDDDSTVFVTQSNGSNGNSNSNGGNSNGNNNSPASNSNNNSNGNNNNSPASNSNNNSNGNSNSGNSNSNNNSNNNNNSNSANSNSNNNNSGAVSLVASSALVAAFALLI